MVRKFGLLIALLAACDEDDPARHLDAGQNDAPQIDAPVVPQPVTLTVTSNGVPTTGVVVHFQNADSTLVATEMTDANGTASHVMAAGGYVTAVGAAVQPSGVTSIASISTFAGVKPGDHLLLGDKAFTFATMTVALPIETDPNILDYEIHATCGEVGVGSAGSGSGATAQLSLSGCGATTDILVVAKDQTGAIVRYIYKPDQTITDQGSIDLTAASYAAASARTYTFTNVPAGLSTLNVHQHIASAKGELMAIVKPTTGTTDRTVTFAIPVIPNGISVIDGSIFSESGSTHHTLDWGPLSATAFSTNLGARILVDVGGPAFDAAAHKVTWTDQAAGVAPDFATVTTRGTQTDTTLGDRYVDWTMVSPYTAGSATYPVLPPGSYDYNWDADDAVNVYRLSLAKVPGGYDAVRANSFLAIGDPTGVVVGASGSAMLVDYGSVAQARTAPTAPSFKPLQHRTKR